MKKLKLEYFILFFLQLLTNATSVGAAILLNVLIDTAETSIINKDAEHLQNILIVSVIYAACAGLFIYIYRRYKAHFIRKTLLQRRKALASGTLQTGIAEYEKIGNAAYITAFNQNFSVLEEKVLENRIYLADDIIGIIFAVCVLLWMNPAIAVISIGFMAIPGLLPRLFTKSLEKAAETVMKSTTDYNEKVSDLLNGFEVIKMYQAAPKIFPRFSKSAECLEKDKEHLSSLMAMLHGLTTFASIAVQFMVMGLAGLFAVKGYITIGSIVAVTQLTGQVISPAFEVSTKIGEIRAAKPVLETLAEFSNPQTSEKNTVRLLKDRITLKNVTFRYRDKSVLKNVFVTFEKGKKYAIIGKSGSGKSTLLKLIAGYYDKFDGTICTDEYEALPDGVAMIHQKTFLFNDSILNNITMWKSYSDAEVREAVQKAGLTEFIANLPYGMDTLVEENGSNLSGGECQRIAIARALLSHKDVLLMDEATASLDEQTANAIEESILGLKGITCIHVTHRLANDAASKYSKVFAMDAG